MVYIMGLSLFFGSLNQNNRHENKNNRINLFLSYNHQLCICTKQKSGNSGIAQREEGADIKTQELYALL